MAKNKQRIHDAPRLRAHFQRSEAARILLMKRSEWRKMRPGQTGELLIDAKQTPMAKVAAKSSVVASTAEAITSSVIQIRIYRHDPKDEKPYNVDTYSVWEDLPSRDDFLDIVKASSTDYDDNMKEFLEENVLIVPRLPGEDHWLDENELPIVVRYVIDSTRQEDAG
jgi:hypothetical protein